MSSRWAVGPFFLLLCTVLLPAAASAQRLPPSVVPSHYDLAFDVDLAKARFGGTETIRVQLKTASRRIVLNALDIQFQAATITAAGVTQTARVTLDRPTETAALTVPRDIPAGEAEIRITYTGVLNDQLRGFYLSQANGRNYGVTQFESTDARRAFPSFDEPAYKATFDVTLTIDAADNAISNGKLLSDTPGPGAGRHTLTFATSPKMSTYLVAMTVGDFQCLEGEAERIPIRICATPDKKALGHIALDAAQRILTFYNDYYSIDYPFGKLDVVAVPDFAAGAMENTAAIFYREVDLLADEKTASVANVKRIWEVLAHEMAHQWFGDIVTMAWWDDLWLNEGFATWMEKRPLAALKPEWKVDVDEALDSQSAMGLDQLASTRAIHSTVETPAEIEGSFDTIAYEKGAAVMRMIEGYVGADTFRNGVNAYLEKHQFANATSADFWTAITAASGKPVDRILPTFVNRPGVPLVTVTATCNARALSPSLSQERYYLGTAPSSRAMDGPWQIPFCTKNASGGNATCDVMTGATIGNPGAADAARSPGQCPSWTFINAGAKGYYRTAYSPEMLRAMVPDLQTKFTAPERLTLLGDEWAVVRSSRHTVADFLTLASGFGHESSSGVLGNLSARLDYLSRLTTDATRPKYEAFVRTLFTPLYTELGINRKPGDDDDRLALRATVIDLLGGTANDPAVSASARELLLASLDKKAELDPTAANAVIGVAARQGDAALWDRLLAASKAAASPAEMYRYLYALPSFSDPALIERGLRFALTPELRSQDTPSYLGRFLGNPAARVRAWAFIKENWTALQPKVTISLGDVRLVQALGVFCDAPTRDDIRAFFTKNKLPAASRALDQTLETINSCVAFRTEQTPALASWLAARP